MNDKERIDRLLKIAKERQDISLPLGYVVDTIWFTLDATYKRVPKEANKEQTINYIFNTLLLSLISTMVCFGNEEEIKKNVLSLLEDKNVEVIYSDEDIQEIKH